MKMRPPATPLVTIDPYFSIWSMADTLVGRHTRHWTGAKNRLCGQAIVDGKTYRFMGCPDGESMKQVGFEFDYLTTTYVYACDEVTLTLKFTSPLLLDDFKLLSRPVSYLEISAAANDGKEHEIAVKIEAFDELCLDQPEQHDTEAEIADLDGLVAAKMGNTEQKPLNRSGDDLRIDWGWMWLATDNEDAAAMVCPLDGFETATHSISVIAPLTCGGRLLFALAYDDIHSLEYFGEPIDAYWRTTGESFEEILARAFAEYDEILVKCDNFAAELREKCLAAGGEEYVELTILAYRQAIAAHKLCADKDGKPIFVSKECFSNGCAATVDVTYPSIPLFLLYAPELVNAMLRPVFRYAATDIWMHDFAPHDVGTYPLVNGQVYGGNRDPEYQMPIEECGNMLICAYAAGYYSNDFTFAAENLQALTGWAEYLVEKGVDPEKQLCTDDFAGHLAHHCNLSLKAICALACFGRLLTALGKDAEAAVYTQAAKDMAAQWVPMAANGDGSYKLAFDQPGTFSMKYNMVWDKIFGFGLFDPSVMASEIASYKVRQNRYGLPLDNRSDYTKSDWLVWCASQAETMEDFQALIKPLWDSYNETPDRRPMTDWYFTSTALWRGFQNRTVQGAIFIKLLMPQK